MRLTGLYPGTAQGLRLVLCIDNERPLNTPLGRALNRFVGHTLIRAALSPNHENGRTGDQLGV